MSFRDLDEFLLVKPITLPIRGKEYAFPGTISARSGLLLQRIAAAADRAREDIAAGKVTGPQLAAEVLADEEELDLRAEMLGDQEEAMAADGLTAAHVQHVFRTLMTWHMAGPEAAAVAWERLGEAPAPNRASRRQASKGSASTTKRPASTSGTSTRAPKGTPTSRGRGSSSSGR